MSRAFRRPGGVRLTATIGACVAGLVAVGAFSSWFATATFSAVPVPPTVTITPTTPSIVAGQPLTVRVAVSSPGTEATTLNVHPSTGFQGLAFSIASGSGPFLPYAPPSVRAIGLSDLELSPVRVRAGGVVERTVVLAFNFLTQDFPFPSPGNYRLQATLYLQPGDPATGVTSNVAPVSVAVPSRASTDALSYLRANQLGPLMTADAVYELEARFKVAQLRDFVARFPSTPYTPFVQAGLDATCDAFPSHCGAGPVPVGTVAGRVVNAVNGQPVAGSAIRVHEAAPSAAAPCSNPTVVATASSDATGNYSIPGVPAGVGDVEFLASGFLTSCQRGVNVVAGQTVVVNTSLSPRLPEGQLRFVLTWGATPTDLDSHLWLPPPTPYRVAYFRRGAPDVCPFASLDRDVTSGFGPETMTVTQVLPGRYVYAIHNFSGSPALAGSGAQVQIYSTDGLLLTVQVPAVGSGRWWHVVNVDSESGIEEVNQILGAAPEPYPDTAAGCGQVAAQGARSTESAPAGAVDGLPPKQ